MSLWHILRFHELRDAAQALVDALPRCSGPWHMQSFDGNDPQPFACPSFAPYERCVEVATKYLPNGEGHDDAACDAHAVPEVVNCMGDGFHDLPYARALRALQAVLAGGAR